MIGDDRMKNIKSNSRFINTRAFTLIEVLAVIIVLGFIATIFIPNAMEILNENGLKIYKIKEKELVNAAKDYAEYDKNFIAPTKETEKYVTMPQLVSGSYMDKILDNNGNECTAFVKVTLSDVYGYNYDACLICDEYRTDKDFCKLDVYNNL